MAGARRLDAFQCDATFQIAETFYVGPKNGFTPREWEEARVPLPPPAPPIGRIRRAVARILDIVGRARAMNPGGAARLDLVPWADVSSPA